jgi:hypothetical protein
MLSMILLRVVAQCPLPGPHVTRNVGVDLQRGKNAKNAVEESKQRFLQKRGRTPPGSGTLVRCSFLAVPGIQREMQKGSLNEDDSHELSLLLMLSSS